MKITKSESNENGAYSRAVTRETGSLKKKKSQQKTLLKKMNVVSFPCNMKGLVFPIWVLSNTLRYYHHFPLSRSFPDTPQRVALSCTSAFATLPWKHSHGIAHYRNRHLHITSVKLSGEDFNPSVKKRRRRRRGLLLSFAQSRKPEPDMCDITCARAADVRATLLHHCFDFLRITSGRGRRCRPTPLKKIHQAAPQPSSCWKQLQCFTFTTEYKKGSFNKTHCCNYLSWT